MAQKRYNLNDPKDVEAVMQLMLEEDDDENLPANDFEDEADTDAEDDLVERRSGSSDTEESGIDDVAEPHTTKTHGKNSGPEYFNASCWSYR